MSELRADMIPGEVLYVLVEGDTIIWRKASKVFGLELFQIGEKAPEGRIVTEVMKEKKQ